MTAFPSGEGEWLRCQFHAHTVNSDGTATPAELCDHYAAVGFDVLAITDHWHVTDHARDGLVVMPSSELSCHAANPSGEAEALAIGVPELPDPKEPFAGIEELAAWITEHGGAPFVCHPYWSGLTPEELGAAPSLVGIEIWNAGCEIQQGNGLSTALWDALLHAGRPLFGLANDDSHEPGKDSRIGWTWVLAAERSREGVVDALRRGAFYGSAGPRLLGIEIGPVAIEVQCSPARSVRLCSGPWDGCGVNADDAWGDWRGEPLTRDASGQLTAVRFEYPEYWRWARVEVEDDRGRRAWGNAFQLEGEPPAATEFPVY